MPQENNSRKIFHVETVNCVLLSLTALAESVYFLILLCFIFHFMPLTSVFEGHVLSEWQWHLKPEREIFFYRSSVIFCVGLAVALFLIFKNKMNSPDFRNSLFKYLVIKTTLLTVILISLYKILIYGTLPYLTYVIYTAFGLAFLCKVFWLKLEPALSKVSAFLETPKVKTVLRGFSNFAVPVLIIFLLFVPDLKSVFARIFKEDLLYHYDGIVMSAAWAFLKGCKIYVDINYQHGIGMPILIAALSKMSGGFSYENVIRVLMFLSLAYVIACYFFMKTWLKSAWVAFIGIILIIKFQMFHYGVSNPYIWKHPNNLPIRFLFDLPVLLFILLHLRTSQKKFLLLGAVTAGLALFYTTDTGVYLLATFFSYLISLIVLSPHPKCLYHYYMGRSSHTYFYVVIIPLIFILCYWLNEWVKSVSTASRQAILGLAAFFSVTALFMTQSFIEYPNALALKKISYDEERQLLAKEYRFETDAALIRELTAENEPVALFSSFETALLMEAGRKPFFYYFPLTNSRYRNMKDFGGTYLVTQERLQRTLDQLEKEKPRYIFAEKKLLGGVILPLYYDHYVSLHVLVAYLQEKYIP